jgi:hypothetical protein
MVCGFCGTIFCGTFGKVLKKSKEAKSIIFFTNYLGMLINGEEVTLARLKIRLF